MKYSLKLYIDENDNLYEEIYKYDPPRYDVMSKKLLATNVKSLPFMGEITKLPGPENITSDKKYNYCKTYIDKNDYLYSTSQGRLLDTPVENIKYIGEAFSDSYWTNTYYTALISLKDGRIGIHDSEKLKYLKAINYANLTIGSKEKLISDTELLNTSSRSDYFQNQDDLLNKIYSSYDHYKSSTSLYVVVGESMNITTNFDDFEGDEAYSQLFDFIHEDPNYFENSLGRDPSAGSGLESPLTHLDYVGHYVLKPRMKDNPKDDDRFHEYRLENENEARFDVYSHRRPVALMDFKFGENLSNPAYFTLRCMDAGSYDLDHLSQADKGIIKRRFSIKGANDPNWTRTDQGAFTYLKIEKNVDYTVVYEVMDYEGEWSEKLVKQFNLSELPINLKAKIKTKNPAFSIDALPSSEIFSIYDIETEYSKDLKLEIALYDGEIRKGNLITVPFVEGGSGHRDSANTNLIKWKERDLQVPPTLADKAYKLRVTAIDIMNPDKRAVLEFDVAVRTPINLYGEVSPEELQSGESYSLKAFTSKYASQVSVKAFKDTPKEETILLALEGPPLGQMKKWIKDQSVPSLLEGEYDFEFIATTPNGNYESVLVKKKTQNIKLYDFNVHYVSDYDMESMFSGGKKYMVKDLPLDKTDGLLMKMGYAFYFSLKSKGLAKAGDFIKITPKFTDPLGNALDMYYSDGDHESILGLSSSGIKDAKDKFRLYYSGQCLESEYLGSFSSVVIKNDLKSLVGDEEHWKGRYGLPMSAVFTRSGVAPSSKNLYKGPVTVNFEIQGIKDGSVAYDYKASSTWEKERTNAYGHPLNVTKYNTYFIGDVIVVDPSKTSKSDYTAKPVF